MEKSIKRNITFEPPLMRRAEYRAHQYGVSFAEYLRVLVINDSKSVMDGEIEYINDPEMLESLGRAIEDIKAGRVSKIDNVDEFVKSLSS